MGRTLSRLLERIRSLTREIPDPMAEVRRVLAPPPTGDASSLPGSPTEPGAADSLEEGLRLAREFATDLTASGARCHLAGDDQRFCFWREEVVPATAADGSPTQVAGIRCGTHPGGRDLYTGTGADQPRP
jgi:hypothetical protein